MTPLQHEGTASVCACDDPLYRAQIEALKVMTDALNSQEEEIQE